MVKVADPNMFESFSFEGIWCEKDSFEDIKIGKLNYEPTTGFILDLIGVTEEQFEIGKRFDILYGKKEKNEIVTLHDCSIQSTSSAISKVSIIANKMYIGNKPVQPNYLCSIKKVSFSFAMLNKWMNVDIFDSGFDDEGNYYLKRKKVEILREYVSAIGAYIKEDFTMLLRDNSYSTNIMVEKFFTLEYEENQTLEIIRDHIYKISQLFYFLFKVNVPIKFIEFQIEEEPLPKGFPKSKFRFYYQQNNIIIGNKKSERLIKYDHVADKLGLILEEWFNSYNQIETIVQGYVGDFQENSFLETQFLNACRNIEIYHRVFIEEKKPVPEGIEDTRNLLLTNLEEKPENIKKYFVDRINHTEEGTLSVRIKETINYIPNDVLKEILSFKNKNLSSSKKKFQTACVQTRNYLTHGDQDKEKYPCLLENLNMMLAIEFLRFLTEFFVLGKVGIDLFNVFNSDELRSRYSLLYNYDFS